MENTVIRDCPFCASSDVQVAVVEPASQVLAVRCSECGAEGPPSLSDDPKDAVIAWNERMGRLSLAH